MARDADSLLIEKWAATGETETPETAGMDRDKGWDAAYSVSGGPRPQRKVFNELFKEHTAMLDELNKAGALLEWDGTVIDYAIGSVVKGSDNVIYFATAASGPATTAKNPTTGGNRPDFWVSFDEKVLAIGPLEKLDATVDPDADNDDTEGYSVGSKWVNVTDDTLWFCVDATEAAAVWTQVGAGGGKMLQSVFTKITTGSNDITSTSYTDISGHSVVITPKSTTSKIHVKVMTRSFFINTSGRTDTIGKIIEGASNTLSWMTRGQVDQNTQLDFTQLGVYTNTTLAAKTFKYAANRAFGPMTVRFSMDTTNNTHYIIATEIED